jgi:hypothetical protein
VARLTDRHRSKRPRLRLHGGLRSSSPQRGVVVTVDVWPQWAFWLPPREEYLALHLSVPGEELSYPADDRLFAVADQFLRELGRLD